MNEEYANDPTIRPIVEKFLMEIQNLPLDDQNKVIDGIITCIKKGRAEQCAKLSSELGLVDESLKQLSEFLA